MSDYLSELNKGLSPNPSNNIFSDIWNEYERAILHKNPVFQGFEPDTLGFLFCFKNEFFQQIRLTSGFQVRKSMGKCM